MRVLVTLAFVLASLSPALAQNGRSKGHYRDRGYAPQQHPGYAPQQHPGYSPQQYPAAQRQMPPPERRMGWDERQRLREQVRGGQMSREEARARWREQRSSEPGRSPEQREQLRRDVVDADRDLQRR